MIYKEIRPVLKLVYDGLGQRADPQEMLKVLNEMRWVTWVRSSPPKVSPHLSRALTGFRHRRQDARLAVCLRFFAELKARKAV